MGVFFFTRGYSPLCKQLFIATEPGFQCHCFFYMGDAVSYVNKCKLPRNGAPFDTGGALQPQ